MNTTTPKQHTQPEAEHGTMTSYIIGFILSLIFTINAYYIVVSKSATGTRLLATILVFAVLQMAVQVFFFLHLGRGPKPLYNVTFFVGTIALILVVVVGSIFITDNLHYNMSPSQTITRLAEKESIAQVEGTKTGACEQIRANHKVTISGNQVSPRSTTANQCDTLTIINEDATTRTITFGSYPQHVVYGGLPDVTAHKGYPKVITLNQLGNYQFYDTSAPSVTGSFSVTK